MNEHRCETLEEFWVLYVTQHQHPLNRLLHYLGGCWFLGCLIASAVLWNFWFVLLAYFGYIPSWIGHVVFEGNRPLTLGAPLWAGYSECKMLLYGLTGRMKKEVDRVMSIQENSP